MTDLMPFQKEVGKWGDDTFGKGVQTTKGVISHLRKEVKELTDNPTSRDEAADCLLLLLQLAYEQKYDLLAEAKKKHKINLGRKWGKPDKDGCIEHIRK